MTTTDTTAIRDFLRARATGTSAMSYANCDECLVATVAWLNDGGSRHYRSAFENDRHARHLEQLGYRYSLAGDTLTRVLPSGDTVRAYTAGEWS